MLELMKKPNTSTGTIVIKSLMKEMSVKHKNRKKTIRHEPRMKMIAEIVYMYPVVPLRSVSCPTKRAGRSRWRSR